MDPESIRQAGTASAPETPSSRPVPPAATGKGARRVGGYELLAELARGAMGVIYKARHLGSGELVALKTLRGGRSALAGARRRFRFEADAAAGLDHPGIVPILEVGEDEGLAYYAMALVEGTNLAEMVAENPLPPRRAAEIVARVAEALDHAHRRGVVHRDLKPANVLIDPRGHPRLIDFGLAKRTEGEGVLAAPGMAVGTPCFMAPEQARGRTDVGPAADIYGLGSLLYCLLTSRPPLQAATIPETLRLVAEYDPVPPRRLNPTIPADLDAIVMRCLRKDPRGRFATAAEVSVALRHWLEGPGGPGAEAGGRVGLGPWCRRHPLRAAALGLATGAALLGAACAAFLGR